MFQIHNPENNYYFPWILETARVSELASKFNFFLLQVKKTLFEFTGLVHIVFAEVLFYNWKSKLMTKKEKK